MPTSFIPSYHTINVVFKTPFGTWVVNHIPSRGAGIYGVPRSQLVEILKDFLKCNLPLTCRYAVSVIRLLDGVLHAAVVFEGNNLYGCFSARLYEHRPNHNNNINNYRS